MRIVAARLLARTVPLMSSPVVVPSAPGADAGGRRLVIWPVEGRLYGFDFGAGGEELPPTAEFVLGGSARDTWGAVVAPDGGCVVRSSQAAVECVGADGVERWRLGFEAPTHESVGWLDCAFSTDGAQVWVYRPDAMLGRGEGGDRWLVLDAEDGRVLAEAPLPTVGQGARQMMHPDGRHVLLDVGEGQDGVQLFRGALVGERLEVHEYPWDDRCLIDVSPDGREFMTVGHGTDDAVFHAFPDGEELCSFGLERFVPEDADQDEDADDVEDDDDVEEEQERIALGWSGGYLNEETAVITLTGESGDVEWTRHQVVDLASGAILGELPGEPRLLGDGTWVAMDDQGRLSHWGLR
ncbi:hypothetical protein [Peterkaempfera sp. SMS 1(5)a]|uniref:hypothetical protein n=1 Tax=Peterkaempfera podocarpi TaxID=3232308 RepID=UPI003670AA9D